MATFRRWRVEGGTYFFTLVTDQRRRFLTGEIARSCLRNAFKRVRARYPFNIVAIVLLPDHLHTVWELPRNDSDYATRWRQIKTTFTRSYLKHLPLAQREPRSVSRQKRDEQAVWQRRFFEHTCLDEDDLKQCVDYIHFNPVKHNLVPRVCDWPWSSFHRFVKLKEYDRSWGGNAAEDHHAMKWAE